MRTDHIVAIALIAASLILPACSASRARPDNNDRIAEIPLEIQAWQAARLRLHSMCPQVPKTADQLEQALTVKQENDCYARLAKDTAAPMVDDWHWHWLPPYQVVVAVHDEELRKRVTPNLYEEYMSGLTRYLAEKADKKEITPQQFRYAFKAGWNWLSGKLQGKQILWQENARSAEVADPTARNMMSAVAGELATVTTLALAVSAHDRAYQPAPANCYAYHAGEHNYTIQCY